MIHNLMIVICFLLLQVLLVLHGSSVTVAAFTCCRSSNNYNINNQISLIELIGRKPTLLYAKKKGFGSDTKSNSKKTSTFTTTSETGNEKSTISSTPVTTPSISSLSSSTTTTTTTPVTSSQQPVVVEQKKEILNAGQIALEKLRRERAEQKDNELRKVREMLELDEQVKTTPASIPEVVAQRMGKRMLPFVGVPLFTGMGTFVTFWYMATYRELEFQPALVAISTIVILVVGLLGITYSVMSASWDVDREGSFFGFDEFLKNIQNIQQGFTRTKENSILRDKMANLNENEIQNALKELEKREKKQQQQTASLQTKIQDEMES